MKFASLSVKVSHFFKKYNFFYGSSFVVFFALFTAPFAVLHKFLDPYSTIKWIIILFSFNLSIFLLLWNGKSLILPQLSQKALILVGSICFLIFFNTYLHNVPWFSFENMRRFTFWGAVLFFFNFFYSQKKEGLEKIEKCIFGASFLFLTAAFTQYILRPQKLPYLTFGNINLSAEFIGFSLAFQFGNLVRSWKDSRDSFFLEALSSVSIAYIYFTSCRSIALSVILMVLFTLYLNKNFAVKVVKILAATLIIIMFIKAALFLLHSDIIPQNEKSFLIRWLLYADTLKMIEENPFGVGVGQFEFASIPYVANLFPEFNERILFLSPHDEFLHFLAEDGIPLSLLFFSLALVLTLSFWEKTKKILSSHPEFSYFSIILLIQSLFQFPLIDPLPYVMTALMLGYFFSLKKEGIVIYELRFPLRLVLLGANLLSFIAFTTYFSAKYVSLNFRTNQNLNKIACSFGNRNWMSCLNVGASYLNNHQYEKAGFYASRTLEWQPLNYHGMKLLGIIEFYQGNRKKACRLFEHYDSFFQNQSSLHKALNKVCSPISRNKTQP